MEKKMIELKKLHREALDKTLKSVYYYNQLQRAIFWKEMNIRYLGV